MSLRSLLTCCCALLLAVAASTPAAAQPQPLDGLRPRAQARLVPEDTSLTFRTRAVAGGRMDVDDQVLRAAYRVGTRVAAGLAPEAAARAYLRDAADRYGLGDVDAALALVEERATPVSRHLTFEQRWQGVPVYGRRVKVNLDRSGQPTMVLSGYAPHLDDAAALDVRPSLSAAAAADRVRREALDGAARLSDPELMVWAGPPPRLVWRVVAWPAAADAEYEVLVDAHTGALVQVVDQSTHGPAKHAPRAAAPSTPSRAAAAPAAALAAAPVAARVDGTGYVFDPDPLTTAGVPYAPPYVDGSDGTGPELDAQRRLVTLPGIARGNDGLYRLEGPYVRIVGETNNGGDSGYIPPAETSPDGFRYQRSEPGFEAVSAYYHVDQSQRYVQALGFPDLQNGPITVNPRGFTRDDSNYLPARNFITFGTGGVDDAEDANVVWHEYGHALLEAGAAGLRATNEGKALHEGWSDYWAGSRLRDLVESGAVPRTEWRTLFKWDSGDGAWWTGRALDREGRYPEDAGCDAIDGGSCEIYGDGLLWATTLMEVYDDLGRATLDPLLLQAHYYLSAPVTFVDAAEALLQADADLNGSANTAVLVERLGARGYLDPGAYGGPTLSHAPLPATEALGGTVTVTALADGASDPVASVRLVYGIDAEPATVLPLQPLGTAYSGSLPLPERPATVRYYLEAEDAAGRLTRLPAGAPAKTYRFDVGPDAEPPSIEHAPPAVASLAYWPPRLYARVRDNLAVDSVWVEYAVETASGQAKLEGRFAMERADTLYAGLLPVARELVTAGDVVRYAVRARDAAAAGNAARLPADGTFAVTVADRGLLHAFDFDAVDGDVWGDGAWARAAPGYGLGRARSGTNVWATAPGGAYPAATDSAALYLPPVSTGGLDDAYLVFWHWYDLEHDGGAAPERDDAVLYDGGVVQASDDGGATWATLTPEGGYRGTVISSGALAGQAAFGGYSYGWRREIVTLPRRRELRLRFLLATDADNSRASRFGYAGWYLDDVVVTTDRPTDVALPEATALPEAFRSRSVGRTLPPIEVRAGDDTGVADVLARYRVETATGTRVDVVRLEMDPDDPGRFVAEVPDPPAMQPGDRFSYRLTLSDFDGNVAFYPPGAEERFVVEYRVTGAVAVLYDARPSGRWRRDGEAWTVNAAASDADARSALVLPPLDLPANASEVSLVLRHQYNLGDGLGGNVKVSLDNGATWRLLDPAAPYGTTYAGGGHPMDGEGVFAGPDAGPMASAFDLTPYGGRQVRLRVDFGAARPMEPGEYWAVDAAVLEQSTVADDFETPRELALLENFPDPFDASTTFSYTLPDTRAVTLEVYDVLGRRVAQLVRETQEAGTYTFDFAPTGLASGVYFLRLQAGGEQRVERLMVAR